MINTATTTHEYSRKLKLMGYSITRYALHIEVRRVSTGQRYSFPTLRQAYNTLSKGSQAL